MIHSNLASILQKYLLDHSARKLNFLYWNIVDLKEASLCFVNLTGKDLTRFNNEDLVFRIVKVLNKEDWLAISAFFDNYIVDSTDKKATYTVRLDYLLSYLKVIGYDLDKFALNRTGFGTGYSVLENMNNSKAICTLDNDIQSLNLIDKLYTKYKELVYPNTSYIVEDITNDYMKTDNYRYHIMEPRVSIPFRDGIDGISRKFANKVATPIKIEAIRNNGSIVTVANRFEDLDSIITVSVRVYLQYFLKKFKRKKGELI